MAAFLYNDLLFNCSIKKHTPYLAFTHRGEATDLSSGGKRCGSTGHCRGPLANNLKKKLEK